MFLQQKYILSAILIAFSCCANFAYPIPTAYPPVYSQNSINLDILKLAKINKPSKSVLPPIDNLSLWNNYLQAHFLRPMGTDHADIVHTNQYPTVLELQSFEKLGLIHPIYPQRNRYDLIFIFGGSPETTFKRFKFLSENIKNKLIQLSHHQKIIYINGFRKLHANEQAESKKLGVQCVYQHECAQLLWDKYFAELPVKLDIMTINPPPGRRANTDDTLKALYATLPTHKQLFILGYSNTPYVPYQSDTARAVAIRENKQNLTVEVVGGGSVSKTPKIVFTDTIARRVYTFFALTAEQKQIF